MIIDLDHLVVLLRLCRAHIDDLPFEVFGQILIQGPQIETLGRLRRTHLDAFKGDFELEWILEVTRIVKHNNVADVDLGKELIQK